MQFGSCCCSRAATCAARLCWRRRLILSTSTTHLDGFVTAAQTDHRCTYQLCTKLPYVQLDLQNFLVLEPQILQQILDSLSIQR